MRDKPGQRLENNPRFSVWAMPLVGKDVVCWGGPLASERSRWDWTTQEKENLAI